MSRIIGFAWLLPALLIMAPVRAAEYDPLRTSDAGRGPVLDLTVHDAARARDIPVRVYLPATTQAAPLVLFSHGLGGSRTGSAYLGQHWSARGYVAVFVQHPGSDGSVWQDVPPAQRMAAMRQAANLQNFMLRVHDVPAVLDQLDAWNRTQGHALMGRLDMSRVAMSGHSFGAVTTQAMSGQTFGARGGLTFTDPRIRAAIIMSPSTPRQGDAQQAFGNVKIPWLLMTGTRDLAPIGGADMNARLGVYPALPPGHKYQIVLYDAEHSAFTDRALPGDTQPRNPNHHRVILALSTAFLDAYLKDDKAATAWLDGDGPKSVIEPKDRWERK